MFRPTPNGWKVSIAHKEFGLPYYTHLIDIGGDAIRTRIPQDHPNNRMPAINDPDWPVGTPISFLESGSILQYLGCKIGKSGGNAERDRIAVDQWLMWQMGYVGPLAGQCHHFLKYAPQMGHDIPYAKILYRNETARLYAVLDRQLAENEYVAGQYSIADMAIWPWPSLWEGQEHTLDDTPHLARWLEAVGIRPAVQKGRALHADKRKSLHDKSSQDRLSKQKG